MTKNIFIFQDLKVDSDLRIPLSGEPILAETMSMA